jgi:light-regulated signal transduction histidine kinase (bacteriophytochrome)
VTELTFVTEARQRLEEQAAELTRSNSDLEQFAYVASHDLQDPLRKVTSFCQLLERRYHDALDDRGRQYVDFAVDGAQRMQVLINDLLTFSRVGRLHDKRTDVALDDTLDRALDALSTRLQEQSADVRRPASLPTITGDATLLTMLWRNLIGNALKFRDPSRTPRSSSRSGVARESGVSLSLTTASASIRSSPTRSSSSSSACTPATLTVERASAWPCARRSSSSMGAASGWTPPC